MATATNRNSWQPPPEMLQNRRVDAFRQTPVYHETRILIEKVTGQVYREKSWEHKIFDALRSLPCFGGWEDNDIWDLLLPIAWSKAHDLDRASLNRQ